MKRYARAFGCFATMACLLFSGWQARPSEAATDLGTYCWLTEYGKLLRFSVTQTDSSHFIYSGTFIDDDDATYAIIGHVNADANTLIGSFSGAKGTASHFATGIALVTLNPVTLTGSAEIIRHKYERSTGVVSTAYQTRTLTRTQCP